MDNPDLPKKMLVGCRSYTEKEMKGKNQLFKNMNAEVRVDEGKTFLVNKAEVESIEAELPSYIQAKKKLKGTGNESKSENKLT